MSELSFDCGTTAIATVSGVPDHIGAGTVTVYSGTDLVIISGSTNPTFETVTVTTSLTISGQPVSTGTGGVSAHSSLTGLTAPADDHTQYILADGTRPLSADWDNIGRRIRNTGTAEVAGTAPLTPATGLLWLDTTATGGSGASVEPAIVGSDGITVVSGASTTEVQGFRTEFVSASGSLQDQIDTIDPTTTLQEAYDNGDGFIITDPGKPVVVTGTGGVEIYNDLTLSGVPLILYESQDVPEDLGTMLHDDIGTAPIVYSHKDVTTRDARVGDSVVIPMDRTTDDDDFLVAPVKMGLVFDTSAAGDTSGDVYGFWSKASGAGSTFNLGLWDWSSGFFRKLFHHSTATNIYTGNSNSPSISITGVTVILGLEGLNQEIWIGAGKTTAADPKVVHEDDTDTGFYWPAPDTLGIAASGIERLVVSGGGDTNGVGINGDLTVTGGIWAPSGTYSDSLTISGVPVATGTGLLAVSMVTADTTLTTAHNVVLCDATSGIIVVTLPTAPSNTGRNYFVKKIDSTANVVTTSGINSETIDGSLIFDLVVEDESIHVVCDGSNWFII